MSAGGEKRKNNHRVVTIDNILITKDIPVLPNCFEGNHISRDKSIALVDKGFDNDRGRHQCNNLIYSAEQMPDREVGSINNNGWGKVRRKPPRSKRTGQRKRITGYIITTPLPPEYCGHKYAGEIHVQYFYGPPEESVYEGVTSVLNTHGGVRTFPNKHSQMAAAGLRMDLVSSSIT